MNTRFVIPAAVAMALHALPLMMTRPGSTTAGEILRPVPKTIERVIAVLDLSVPPESDPENQGAVTRGNPDVRRSDEPLRPDVSSSDFLVPKVDHPPGPITDSPTIPVGPFGPPDGIDGIGPGPGVMSYTGLDRPPQTRSRISPVYPYEAKNDGRPGEVLVEFVVDENGRVLNPHVIRSSDSVFEGPTLRAVSKWRFEPGRKQGRPVRFRMALPVQFSVND